MPMSKPSTNKAAMKFALMIFLCAALAGCGQWGRTVAIYTGWSVSCVEGVNYLQFASGVTVQYTPDGKVKTCSGVDR